jgi:hypothetical protein
VTPEIIQATSPTTPDLVSGKMEQNSTIKFKYVAPDTVAAANVSEILVPKSSLTRPADRPASPAS